MSPKVGRELAFKVSQKLRMGNRLMFSHRDYCGTGLMYVNGTFVYGHVYDGEIQDSIREFRSEENFLAWLAEQSDESLRGAGEDKFFVDNQRITVGRLWGFTM